MVSTGISAFKNAYKSSQRDHKERSQPKNRKNYGLLEKHKDYKLRANDFNTKRDKIKKLKRLARDKNPDSFYFRMINEKTKDGIHYIDKTEKQSFDENKDFNQFDLNYLNMKIRSEENKISKLQSSLHFIDEAKRVKRTHIIFVDNETELENYGKEEEAKEEEPINNTNLTIEEKRRISQQCNESYNELSSRIDRLKKLKEKRSEMELLKNINNSKKSKEKFYVKQGPNDKKPVYRWGFCRKR